MPLSSHHTRLFLLELQPFLGSANVLFIPHAHLRLPGEAPHQYVILAESRDSHQSYPRPNNSKW